MIVADITRSFDNTVHKCIRLMLRRMTVTGQRATLVFHQRQRAMVGSPPGVTLLAVTDWVGATDIAPVIRDQIAIPLMTSNLTETLEIYSFHSPVLALPSLLPPEQASRTTVGHWSNVNEDGTIFSSPFGIARPPSPPTIPAGAVEALLKALRMNPKGLVQTTLRDLVVGQMPELDKKQGGPPISAIVAAARARGLVNVAPVGHVNPTISLVQADSTGIVDSSRLNADLEDSDSRQSSAAKAPAKPDEKTDSIENRTISAPVAADQRALDGQAGASQDEPPSRVEQFYEFYRQNDFGPFPRHRQQMFDELEKLAQTGKYSANRLVKKAARTAVIAHGMPYGWSTIESFLYNLLGRRPVLLDRDGTARSPKDASSTAHPITQLSVGWRDLLESEMVVFLAEHDGVVKMKELDWVGYVMFANYEDDELALERIEKLVAVAEADGRIHTVDGVLVAGPDPTRPTLTVMPPNDSKPGGSDAQQKSA